VFGAPGNVTCLTALLVLTKQVPRVAHHQELMPELGHQLLGLQLRIFFVRLHPQKHHVALLGTVVLRELLHGLREHLLVLLVVGDDEGVQNLRWQVGRLDVVVEFAILLHLLSSVEDVVGLGVGDDGNEEDDEGFE
jgi:hypothetical protein